MAISKIDSDGIVSGGITADSLNIGQIGGRRNLIINGAMQVAQRGTSFTGLGNGESQYLLDRFRWNENGDPTYEFTATQDSNAPDGFAKSLKVDITTADTALGTNDTLRIKTILEAQNLQSLAYGTSSASSVTLSFYVKSTTTGTYKVWIYSEDGNRSSAKAYTINTANTWERKTLTFSGDTSGTINDDTGKGFDIEFFLAAGTDWTSGTDPDGTWEGHTKANVAAGQTVNLASSTSNDWAITGVQLEVGSVATPFEHRSYGEELALCQRYFWLIEAGSGERGSVGNGAAYVSSNFTTRIPCPVEMRAGPTMSVSTSSNDIIIYGNAAADSTSLNNLSLSRAFPYAVVVQMNAGIAVTQGYAYWAELNNTANYKAIKFDAEL